MRGALKIGSKDREDGWEGKESQTGLVTNISSLKERASLLHIWDRATGEYLKIKRKEHV